MMKKELRTLLYTQTFLGICLLIGTVIAKPIIESKGQSFWLVFGLLTVAIIILTSLSLLLKHVQLKKKPANIPDVDERTFDNLRNVMLWNYVIILSLFSLVAFILLFTGVKSIATSWLVVGMLLAWISLIGSFWFAKRS